MKTELPSYDGKLTNEVFLDWLDLVEGFLDYMGAEEENKIKFVKYKLNKVVLTYLKKLQSERVAEGKRSIKTWGLKLNEEVFERMIFASGSLLNTFQPISKLQTRKEDSG